MHAKTWAPAAPDLARPVHAGGIGHSYELQVACQLTTTGQNALVPPLLPIPALTFPITIDFCPEGTQQKGPLCAPCDTNTFNFDGISCKPCPTGTRSRGRA